MKTADQVPLAAPLSILIDPADPSRAKIDLHMSLPLSAAAAIVQIIADHADRLPTEVSRPAAPELVAAVKPIQVPRRFRGRGPVSESLSWVWVFGGMRLQKMGAAWVFDLPESRDSTNEIYILTQNGMAIAVLILHKTYDLDRVRARSQLYRCDESVLPEASWDDLIEPALYNLLYDHISSDGDDLMPDEKAMIESIVMHLVDTNTSFPAEKD